MKNENSNKAIYNNNNNNNNNSNNNTFIKKLENLKNK